MSNVFGAEFLETALTLGELASIQGGFERQAQVNCDDGWTTSSDGHRYNVHWQC